MERNKTMIDALLELIRRDKRVAIGGIVLIVLVLAVLFSFGTSNKSSGPAIQTGGNYSPTSTDVVFHNSNKLYAQLRSSEMDALRGQLAQYAERNYGKGSYQVAVVGDALHYDASSDGPPPSYWFEVTFDKHSGTLRVDVDMSSGEAVFTLEV